MSGENRFFNSISGVLLTTVCIGRPFRTIVNSLFSNAAGVTFEVLIGVSTFITTGVTFEVLIGAEATGTSLRNSHTCSSSSCILLERCSTILKTLIMSAWVGGEV